MALPATENPPYSYINDDKVGIYQELLDEIFAHTPFTINYIYLSSARIRTHFTEQITDVECCPISSWRQGEEEISLYTTPILATEDVLVFAKGQVKQFASLKGVDVAVVAGYGYKQDDEFNRIDVTNELLILKLVANNRAPVGIVDRKIAKFLIDKHELPISIGQVHEAIERPLRLHAKHKDKLSDINLAIAKLKQDNTIAGILNRYELKVVQ